MTNEQIIKTAENCVDGGDCGICPYESCRKLYEDLLDIINRQKAENEDLFYKLTGVMVSVDKWLEGVELEQDEVNRAATMREKTLRITEEQQAEIERLKGSKSTGLKEIESTVSEFWTGLQKLSMYKGKEKPTLEELLEYIEQVKEEAYKEFAEQLQDMLGDPFLREHNDVCVVIDNLLAELTPTTLNKLPHSSLCETETVEGVTDICVGGKNNDFKEDIV